MTSVQQSLDDGLFTVIIANDERRNALTAPVVDQLAASLTRAAEDPAIRGVVLTGRGEAFCSGGDLRVLDSTTAAGRDAYRRYLAGIHQRIVEPLVALDKPVTAAVNGWAVGAGFSLALAADFRVMSRDATILFRFLELEMAPDCGIAHMLPRGVGLMQAKELLLRGAPLSAPDALRANLVTETVAKADVLARASALTRELMRTPTAAFAGAKRLLRTSYALDLHSHLAMELQTQVDLLGEQVRP